MILDSIDLKILNLLGRNSRRSYRNIAELVNFTTKATKDRVDKLVLSGIIDKFVTLIDPKILGYSKICSFALKETHIDSEMFGTIRNTGDIQFQFKVLGGAVGYSLLIRNGEKKSEDDEEKLIQEMLHVLKPALLGFMVHDIMKEELQSNLILTKSDLQIIRQLVLNPRISISDMSKELSISTRTVLRRLDRIQNERYLEFTILPNPEAMKGQLVIFLDIRFKISEFNGFRNKSVIEKINYELRDNIVLSTISNDHTAETIGLILACSDTAKAEYIRVTIEKLEYVRECRVFFPTRIEYNHNCILKAVDKKIMQVQNG